MKFSLRNFLITSSALTGCLATSSLVPAEAATFSVTNSLGAASAGANINGAFDISGFLSSEAAAGNTVTINGATVQLYGYSQPQNTYVSTYVGSYVAGYYAYTGSYYYSYSCGWSTCYGVGYYTAYAPYYGSIYNDTNGDNQKDVVLADFGNQHLSGSTAAPTTTSYAAYTYAEVYTTTGHSSGNVSDSALLSSISLNELSTTNALAYALSVTDGSFDSLGMELDIDFTAVTSMNVGTTPIPPAALLFGTGLGALGVSQLRRRKKKTVIEC